MVFLIEGSKPVNNQVPRPSDSEARDELRPPEILHRPDGFLLHPAARLAAHLSADGRGGPGRVGGSLCHARRPASLGRLPVRELSLRPPGLPARLLADVFYDWARRYT